MCDGGNETERVAERLVSVSFCQRRRDFSERSLTWLAPRSYDFDAFDFHFAALDNAFISARDVRNIGVTDTVFTLPP